MRIAISNLAWEITEDTSIADLLQTYGICAIDVAPGKYFPDLTGVSVREIEAVRRWWNDRGVEITGMQALLYGTKGLNLFAGAETQLAMLSHLEAVCRMGAILGATRLVFGSPRNRDRSALSDESTQTIADGFFRRLGDLAAGHGVLICLEPNPPCYGGNFMTNSAETAAVVRSVAHPAIRMQFDTGAISINQEDPAAVLNHCAELVGHIHLSEPNLLPLGDGQTDHAALAQGLALHLPNHVATIEMLVTEREAPDISITRGLKVALRHYRQGASPRCIPLETVKVAKQRGKMS